MTLHWYHLIVCLGAVLAGVAVILIAGAARTLRRIENKIGR